MRYERKTSFVPYLVFYILIVWLAVLLTPLLDAEGNIFAKMGELTDYLSQPFVLTWLPATPKYIGVFSFIYAMFVLYSFATTRKTRNGEEHGSAILGDAKQLNKKYRSKKPTQNVILTKHFRIGLDMFRHQRNLHVMVIGGSGAGKTRYYVIPNLLQANTSFIVTDPKGELVRGTAGYLQSQGYEVRVFDTIHPETSMCYNPFVYISKPDDVLSLITNFVRNTTPKESRSSDPFWEKAETALLQALMLYLWYEAPPDEQNFEMILDMLCVMAVNEDSYGVTPVDGLMIELQKKSPYHVALRQYSIFKTAPAKTANSIVISAAVRLAQFGLPGIARMTSRDELDLPSIGQKKVALFAVIHDSDQSYNFLVSMLYTQVFQQLERIADEQPDGRVPEHVHCIMDEFANIPLPEAFENVLSTSRSREISISIILQSVAQLKALFEKKWEAIISNCDELLYLGGNEQSTHKFVSEYIGRETIDTTNYSQSRGRNGSYSTSFQKSGRELLTPDEVRRIPRSDAVLFVASEPAVIDKKYDLLKHPAIHQTSLGGGRRFDYRIGLARMYANGLRPSDYEILWNGMDEDAQEAQKDDTSYPAAI